MTLKIVSIPDNLYYFDFRDRIRNDKVNGNDDSLILLDIIVIFIFILNYETECGLRKPTPINLLPFGRVMLSPYLSMSYLLGLYSC